MYYSGWYQSFPAGFARTVANEGAVPLVQMDPENISIAAIASGHYDGYLTSYAEAVRHYHHPVIVSFGHEMNGDWYSWGYQNVPRHLHRGLAAHRQPVPRARRAERHLAVDRQRDGRHPARQDPEPGSGGGRAATT